MKKIMVFILAFFMLSMNFCTGFIYAKSSNPKILKQLPKEPDVINSEPDSTEKEPVEQIGNENIFIYIIGVVWFVLWVCVGCR